jgi:hypothetical protein
LEITRGWALTAIPSVVWRLKGGTRLPGPLRWRRELLDYQRVALDVPILISEAATKMSVYLKSIRYVLLASVFTMSALAKPQTSPGKDIGSGAGNIGTGAAKGAASAAKGTAKGAGDLVTLHPIGAAKTVGKGAAGAGKDVTVGTARGTGKIVKGVGKAFKKVF